MAKKIFIPDDWSQALKTIARKQYASPPPTAFICGPKNSGKTTFSRHLVNELLPIYKKVAYLDTDVGQAEFTPPGLVSLIIIDEETSDLAIPCMKTPERSYFFGDISSKSNPSAYLECIDALYDHYKKVFYDPDNGRTGRNMGLPLVINTPGWVKGNGYDMLKHMVNYMSPSHVVKISISAEPMNLPVGVFRDYEAKGLTTVIDINSARRDSLNRSVLVKKDGRLLRESHIMAYFRQCFPPESNIDTIKKLARELCLCSFHAVPRAKMKIKHLHGKVSESEIFYSLNASIVGMAVSSEQLPQCLGLGLVRGVDLKNEELWIITPIPIKDLAKVDVLLKGRIQIPTCLMTVKGCVSPYMSKNVLPGFD